MKKFLLSILFFVGVLSVGFGQATFVATQNGNWNDGATWGNTSPGTAGVDFPSSIDDAFTNGFNITTASPSFARNVFVEDGATAITFQQPLTVTGTMTGWSGGQFGFTSDLTSNVFSGASRVTFTATNFNSLNGNIFNNEILAFWNENTPITVATFNFNGSHVIDAGFSGGDIRIIQLFCSNGNLSTGFNLTGIKIQNILRVTAGSFSTDVPLYGVSGSASRFGALQLLGGDLNLTSTNSYCNANNVTINNGSELLVGFSGSSQTQGWWFDNIFPANFNIDVNSTVEYSGNADQSIFAVSTGYGNLILNSSNSVTKTLVGAGNLLVKGSLNISSAAVTFASTNTNPITIQGNISNEGTWTTTQRVNLTGTNSQIINGSNPITFGEEVRIDKSSGNVTLQLVDQTINADLRILQGTFRPLARTVTLSGNIINDGTIEATQNGAGGFVFNGTTEISSPGGTGVTQFRNVTINNGATLTQEAGSEIEVTTNFTNNGAFTHNDGSVRFRQTGTKSISGSSSTAFFDLAAAGGTLNINGTVDLENTMTFVGSPTVDFDGSGSGIFTLKSTQTRDASIANVGTATLQGNLNIERAVYTLRGDNEGYHMLGFPLDHTVDGATVGEVQSSGFSITGSFTGASTGTPSGDGFASVFSYNETNAGAFSTGYTNFPGSGGSTSTSFNHGDGYFMFTYDGDAPGTITTTGSLFTGNFSKNLSFTNTGSGTNDGWHMVANPYPSATNWDLWTTTNTEADAWIWNPAGGAYEALVDGNGDVLPQGQAFFIRATSSGASVSVNEAAKVSTFQTYYRSGQNPVYVKLGLDNGNYVDYTYLGLKDGASYDYNGEEDASRLLNSYETISTKTADGKLVKVNRIPFQNEQACSNSVFINLEQMVNGKEYTFRFENIANLSSKSIQLHDHYLDQVLEINDTDSLVFTVNADAASKGDSRFEIILENKTPSNVSVTAQDVCPSEDAVLSIENTEAFANYLIYKNDEVIMQFEGTGNEIELDISNEFIDNSNNEFVISAFATGCDTLNVGNASIRIFDLLNLDNNVEGSTICRSENQAAFSISTQIAASYFIVNGEDTIQTIVGDGNVYSGFINSEELVDGVNEFTITASKDGCQSGTLSETLAIEVSNPTIDESIAFSASNTCLKSPSEISFSTQDGVEYKIIKGTTVVSTIAGDGLDQTVTIPVSYLSVGVNEFSLIAEFGDCARFEFPEPIQIEVEENINTNLSLVTADICGTGNASVVIENAQLGKTYTLKSGEDNLSSLTAETDGPLTFNINSNQLNPGLNELDIQIQSEFCGSGLSSNQALFTIYEAINSNLEYLSSDVCNSAEAVVGISNAQAGKTYKLYKGDNLVQSAAADTAGELVFENANNELIVGANTFNIVIESEGCENVNVEQELQITLYEEIDSNLEYLSADVCNALEAVIGISNAQAGKIYKLYKGSDLVETMEATSAGRLVFQNANNELEVGNNAFNLVIESEGCESVDVEQALNIRLYEAINPNLQYLSTNVCNADEAVVGISNAQVGKTYKLYKGDNLVQSVEANAVGELVFENANSELVVGDNAFNIVIESAGCETVNAEQELDITLYEGINADLDILTNDVCTGDQVIIEITNPQVGKTYKLMTSEMELAAETVTTEGDLIFSLSADEFGVGSHVLFVDIIDSNCGSERANQSVEFERFDSAVISEIDDLGICLNESVNIDLTSNVEMSSYQLYLGSELIEETNGSTLALSPTETTTYTLTGVSTSGCEVNEINFTVSVTDLAVPGILVSANVLESSIEADSYQWYLNGEILEDEKSKILVAQQSGDYTVEVSQGNCVAVSEAFTFNEEVLNANRELENAVHLYPNPVKDHLTITTDNLEEIELKIYSVEGEFLDQMTLNSNSNSIDMTKFSAGTYLLQLESGKGSITKRIVKQ